MSDNDDLKKNHQPTCNHLDSLKCFVFWMPFVQRRILIVLHKIHARNNHTCTLHKGRGINEKQRNKRVRLSRHATHKNKNPLAMWSKLKQQWDWNVHENRKQFSFITHEAGPNLFVRFATHFCYSFHKFFFDPMTKCVLTKLQNMELFVCRHCLFEPVPKRTAQ